MVKVAPSILSADFARLGEEVKAVERAGADLIHLDVMDGHFVPNLTIGPAVVKTVDDITTLPLDVHLMIMEPDRYLEDFIKAGADYITVHAEAQHHLHRTVMHIKELGAMAGVAINPATSLSVLEEILPVADLILVMTVNPGFGGQAFIPTALPKIRAARKLIDRFRSRAVLEVDGGVKADNAAGLRRAGTDILVSGSGVFGSTDYRRVIARIRGR